jgi:hypothetical protein
MAANRARALQVIDPFLSTVARRYKSEGFVADRLLPRIKVTKLSGQYPVFDRNYWFSEQTDNKGSDRAPSREVDYEWSLDTYLCEEYKLKTNLTDLEVDQAEPELRLRQSKAEFLAQQMNLSAEIRAATVLTDSGTAGGQLTGGTAAAAAAWDTITTTSIESDIQTAKFAIFDKIGIDPNTIVIPYKVAYGVAMNTEVRKIIAYEIQGGNGQSMLRLGDRLLPPVFHGMNVIVPKAQKTATKEGNSGTLSAVWGEDVRLLWIDPSASWGQPTVAYRLEHTPRTVTRWREIDPDREVIRELERLDEKCVAPDAGSTITNCLV